jgi:hypothetical protein
MPLYYVIPCQGDELLEVEDNGLSPSPGDVISFSSITGDVTCGTVGEFIGPLGPSSYTAITIFNSCYECTTLFDYESPRSAYTEQIICVQVCDDMSGSTVVVAVNPPHPVWTDNYGTEVTQLNAVTLGGINGLNN